MAHELLMHLARQHDTLLRILKSHGLANRIAFLEIHNEPEYSDFPQGEPGRRLHEEAIAFLRARHPDLLVAGDYASHDYSIFPDNAQVFNQHIYAGAGWYFGELYGKTALSAEFDPENPRGLPLLDRLLKREIMPHGEFVKRAESLAYRNKENRFASVYWLYDNIDNTKWDEWQAESFSLQKAAIFERARELFGKDAAEAERRGLPLVLGEGGYFTPPLGSRFELSE